MSNVRSRRGFFATTCGGLLAFFAPHRTATAGGERQKVQADPGPRQPVDFDPTTRFYVFDSQNRLISVLEPEALETTVYTYG